MHSGEPAGESNSGRWRLAVIARSYRKRSPHTSSWGSRSIRLAVIAIGPEHQPGSCGEQDDDSQEVRDLHLDQETDLAEDLDQMTAIPRYITVQPQRWWAL